MDAKITRQRLSRMLSYDWIKIIIFCVIGILVWSLIFAMTATKITTSQQFVVYNYVGNRPFTHTKFYDSYSNAFENGVFSYEVLKTSVFDIAGTPSEERSLMEGHLGIDEGDVIFVADSWHLDSAYEDEETGETRYQYTYLQQFLYSWRFYVYDLNPESEHSYFRQMETYLDGYYTNGWEDAESLDKSAVERDFRARAKKDKRFKKSSQIRQGIQDDITRIQNYRNALEEFYGYVKAGVVTFTRTSMLDPEDETQTIFDGVFTINICPDKAVSGGLSEIVSYPIKTLDENGNEQTIQTAENMNVAFFYMDSTAKGFEFESVPYITYIIRNAIAATEH